MHITDIVLLVAAIILGGYDVYIIIKEGPYRSISAHVIRGSKKYPLLVLAFGIILGHLFWSMDSFKYLPKEELLAKCKAVFDAR